MRIALETECIDVFSVVPRTADPQRYSDGIRIVTRLSDKYGYSGVLVYTGHDVYVEPWLAAQEMIRTSADLAPLVAVNPIYMHPFTAARMIASLAYVYGRRVCLNLVTGTALRDLDSLSQLLSHDDRYERLLEYAVLLQRLLAGGNVTYEGKYYQVRNLQLLPRVPAALLPRFFLAGQSDAARRVARDTGATCLHMLPPTLTASGAAGAGVNLGIITREREQEAWAAARARFPENECGQTILELSMQNTDSEWKRRLSLAAGLSNGAAPGFWLGPFRNFQADQPFFVGSHSQVAELVISLVRSGVCSFVLDVPPDEIEFENIAIAFAQARTRLAA